MMKVLSCLPLLLSGAYAQTLPPLQTWTGCVDPSNPDQLFRSGEKTTVCVVLASTEDWNTLNPVTRYTRLSFQPTVDEYSVFHVPSSYSDVAVAKATLFHDGSNNVTIHAASQTTLSPQRMWYSPSKKAAYPFLTATIKVDRGVVQEILWSDDCSTHCSSSQCEDVTYDFDGNRIDFATQACPVDAEADCGGSMIDDMGNQLPNKCNVKIFVLWEGTDADGKSLNSCSKNGFKESCDRKVEVFEGARMTNGNVQIAVPRKNVTSGEMTPFSTDLLRDMTATDVAYFSVVANEGESNTGCGTTVCSGAAATQYLWLVAAVAANVLVFLSI